MAVENEKLGTEQSDFVDVRRYDLGGGDMSVFCIK